MGVKTCWCYCNSNKTQERKMCCLILMMCLVLWSLASALQYNEEVTPPHQLTKDHVPEVIVSPLPWKYITDDSLPNEFSWTNINGYAYVTPILNQVHRLSSHNLILLYPGTNLSLSSESSTVLWFVLASFCIEFTC